MMRAMAAQSFADVSRTPGVDTVQFCNAAEGLVSIFGTSRSLHRNPVLAGESDPVSLGAMNNDN